MLTIAIGFIGPALARAREPRGARRVPSEAVPRRSRDVPALQRAQRRLRPRGGDDARGTRRRRVGGERSEGVDVERARRRPRARGVPHRSRRTQAPGPHDVPRRHARARRGGASPAPDDGHRRVQRGVPHRRARPRLPPGGGAQQGVRCDPHHARKRADHRHPGAVGEQWHRAVRATARGGRRLRRPRRRLINDSGSRSCTSAGGSGSC